MGCGEQWAAVTYVRPGCLLARQAGRGPPSSARVPLAPWRPRSLRPTLGSLRPMGPRCTPGAAPLQDGPMEFKLQHV